MNRVILLAVLMGVYAFLATATLAKAKRVELQTLPLAKANPQQIVTNNIWIVTPEQVKRMKRGFSLIIPHSISIK